jgi:hypothetical protein
VVPERAIRLGATAAVAVVGMLLVERLRSPAKPPLQAKAVI